LILVLFIVGCLFCWQTQLIVNPKPFLAALVGQIVRVKLKWGMEYQGKLASSDAYMNLHLERTEEFIDGQFAGFLGEVLIRCNNVLYIKAAPVDDGDDDDEEDDGDQVMKETAPAQTHQQ
jgi:small nuclear ribonucleoprotein F